MLIALLKKKPAVYLSLEGTEEVRIAHDFATSAAKGVPRYPSSKSTSDNCFHDNTATCVGGYGSFAPLRVNPEDNDNC